MASTASDLLKLELQTDGENDGTWGALAVVLFERLEEAVAELIGITVTTADYTLDDTQFVKNSGTTAESHVAMIKATGTLTGNRSIIVPLRNKKYLIWNATGGAFTLTVKGSSGDSVVVPQGFLQEVFCDGTNVEAAGPAFTPNGAIAEVEGADVASATTTEIWAADGNTRHITGNTTITSLGTAPQKGMWMKLIVDGTPLLTHGANVNLPGGVNFQCAAGDILFVYADTTTQHDVIIHPKDGLPVVIAAAIGNVVEDTTPQLGGFLDPNGQFIGRDKGGDIASASPLVIDTDGDYFDVTGTTGFSAMTVATNRSFVLQFDGILTITVGSGITLNNAGSNYTTAAGDIIVCQSTAANTVTGWIIKADGTQVVGGVLQVVNTETGAVATGTTTTPDDDTIPQNGEGDEYMTLAITPKSASSTLKITVVWGGANTALGGMTVALFKDSDAAALAAVDNFVWNQKVNNLYVTTFTHSVASASTDARTYKVRAGLGAAGTTTFNGTSGARKLGGVHSSSITITEHV